MLIYSNDFAVWRTFFDSQVSLKTLQNIMNEYYIDQLSLDKENQHMRKKNNNIGTQLQGT